MKETKSQISLFIAVIAAIFSLSSCATIFSGTKDRIVINTTPPGADVYIDGEMKGKSGQDIVLKRKYVNSREVNLRKTGFEDLNFKIDQKITGEYYLNIPFNLCLFCLVDIATGAALKPKQTEFNRILTPLNKESK
jgi:hypothetical protein